MTDLLRESALGQLIRLLSKKRFLKYPEEEPGFTIPWNEIVDEKDTESVAGHIPDGQDRAGSPSASRIASLARAPTERSLPGLRPITSRAISRQQTRPWSAERFEVEREESLERAQGAVIQPQKTKEGVTLVDWYTTDDATNPQNWSFWKKAFVTFQIFLYTFVVYCGSAIYTSSEPEVSNADTQRFR